MMFDQAQFEVLEARLKTLLPEEYRERYEEMIPASMGAAGLQFGSDGRVAWNEMWKSFCDLAMAGGPPHKGTLLEPGTHVEIAVEAARYRQVVEEICRGITMVSGLGAEASPVPGWVRVSGMNHAMAGWLLRAITMENVSVRSCEAGTLDLPAGPGYRLEKEIKNVVTVIAKTCHYWTGHIPSAQKHVIGKLIASMDAESLLIQPGEIQAGWLGSECADVKGAMWRMRMLAAINVLARREGTVVFVPLNELSDPGGTGVLASLNLVHALATARGIVPA